MNQITQFFSNLKADFDRLSQSIDDLVKTYNAIVQLLELVSNLFPLDLVLVLLFSIPLLLVLNSLSPSSPRINYTFSVVFVSGLRFFLQYSISQSWNLWPVLKTLLLLLLPAYGLILTKFVFSWVRKFYSRKKALSPANFELGIGRLQTAYRKLIAASYQDLSDKKSILEDRIEPSKFYPLLDELELEIKGIRNLLEKGEGEQQRFS
ncbi:hypothetical protein CH373_12765 [Leptospira perolatii]|uniref:Uncharacterized protein n=1 Tax=Leptospira perolatii TaxID=2023191 RepID=A0A2M9ZKI8_9LEPT|nr:hypothetical protein [Leptospira perolatii]PJZ70023.1 hypothetical protein CH360_08920 [Leptospira perolatii]PJZ72585.1 hypothetical protein CH373_12765 [Leptospira perolatii]